MAVGGKTPLSKERVRLFVGVAGLGAFLLGVGVVVTLLISQPEWREAQVVKEEAGKMGEGEEAGEKSEEIVIDISGSVEKPGVYRFPLNSRVNDALVAAGGLSSDADRDWVARSINLAQALTDGMKLFIPSTNSVNSGVEGVRERVAGASSQASSFISINTATTTALESLWGVGEVRAKAIVEGRPYGSLEELVTRKILPQSVVERNKDKLSL